MPSFSKLIFKAPMATCTHKWLVLFGVLVVTFISNKACEASIFHLHRGDELAAKPDFGSDRLFPASKEKIIRQQTRHCADATVAAHTCMSHCLSTLARTGKCSNGHCCVVATDATSATLCILDCCSTMSLSGTGSVVFGSNSSYCNAGTSGGGPNNGKGGNGMPMSGAGSSNQPSPSNQGSSGSTCFPSNAIVELESGEYQRIDQIHIGDRIKVAHKHFSDVFMFTHQLPNNKNAFVTISTESGYIISLTPGHYLYLNGMLRPAESAKVGDVVVLGKGSSSKILGISETVESGLYNPQTLHGDIVVNGIVASTYTRAVSPSFGHAWLAPLRAFYRTFGVSSVKFKNGATAFARTLPDGPDTC